tara:strand:- start:1075 stop:1215 length:141 start_codon:yes stop_codon:yes gene_type:complete
VSDAALRDVNAVPSDRMCCVGFGCGSANMSFARSGADLAEITISGK